MKKCIAFVLCVGLSCVNAQSLDQELGKLTTSLNNLQAALSGKPSRQLPLPPEEEAKVLFIAPTVTRDNFKYQNNYIEAWYGIIKDGADAGKLGIYLPEVASNVTVDNFFLNGSMVSPDLVNRGINRGNSWYKMFVLYDPKGGSSQNKFAKTLYEAYVPPVKTVVVPSVTFGPVGPMETDMSKLFKKPSQKSKGDVKFNYGIAKADNTLGFYVPEVIPGTTVADFFAAADDAKTNVKKGDLIYPQNKKAPNSDKYQMITLYDPQTGQNVNAKFLYSYVEGPVSMQEEIDKKKKQKEEKEQKKEAQEEMIGVGGH